MCCLLKNFQSAQLIPVYILCIYVNICCGVVIIYFAISRISLINYTIWSIYDYAVSEENIKTFKKENFTETKSIGMNNFQKC